MRFDLVPLRRRIIAVALTAAMVITVLATTGSPASAAPAQFPETPNPIPLPPLITDDPAVSVAPPPSPGLLPPVLTPEEIGLIRSYHWAPRFEHGACTPSRSGEEFTLNVLGSGAWWHKQHYLEVQLSGEDDQYNRMSPVDGITSFIQGWATFSMPVGLGLMSFRINDGYGHTTEWAHVFVDSNGDCRRVPEGDLFPNLGPDYDDEKSEQGKK